jgi:hypothetical protein
MRRDGREHYAMTPESLVYGGCDGCLRVFDYLDLKQGDSNRPVRGVRSIARELRRSRAFVDEHLAHLVRDGYVAKLPGRSSRSAATYVVMNPARSPESYLHWLEVATADGQKARDGRSSPVDKLATADGHQLATADGQDWPPQMATVLDMGSGRDSGADERAVGGRQRRAEAGRRSARVAVGDPVTALLGAFPGAELSEQEDNR